MSEKEIGQLRGPTEEEQALKAAVRKEMVRDRCRLIDFQPFVGKLAMHLDLTPVIDRRLTTASTDGTHLYVDAEFYSRLAPEERLGVIAHEVWHCALRHFQRRGDRDRDRFNYAADVEVDLLLHQDGFKIEMLPFDPDWIGKTAEQIYELLCRGMEQFQKDDTHLYPGDKPDDPEVRRKNDEEDEQETPQTQEEDEDGGGDGADGDGNGTGENDMDGDGGGSNCDGAGGGGNEPGGNDMDGDGDGNDAGDCLRPGLPRVRHDDVIDPDYCPSFSKSLEDDWKKNLKSAVQQMSRQKGGMGIGKGIGNLPGNVQGLVDDDGLDATVDWKRVLLDYVTQVFGGERQWLPPSRRHVWKKLYLPSRARKKTIEIVLAVDTSASTVRELPFFLAELRGMVNAFGEYKLTIIQCDYSIHSVEEYTNDDPLPEKKFMFRGFGGTSFIPPFEYVRKKIEDEKQEPPTVFIYLTDGGGDAPKKAPDYPVIWCLTGNGQKPADWGLEVWMNPPVHKYGH